MVSIRDFIHITFLFVFYNQQNVEWFVFYYSKIAHAKSIS